jgi:hypothetical protein
MTVITRSKSIAEGGRKMTDGETKMTATEKIREPGKKHKFDYDINEKLKFQYFDMVS